MEHLTAAVNELATPVGQQQPQQQSSPQADIEAATHRANCCVEMLISMHEYCQVRSEKADCLHLK